jgi:L-ascorbate metabolism protein UlaG (beta-lactamase superfamily)
MTTDLSFWGHACIRLDRDGHRLVIDPGSFSSPDALDGAQAVLVTHEHGDHVVLDQLRTALASRPDLEVWAPGSVTGQLADERYEGRVHTVAGGDTFTAAGFGIEALGEHHALIHRDVPVIPNVAYLVDGSVLHPGDSYTVPPAATVDVLCAPTGAPWLKLGEVVDFVRAVAPRRVVPIHDALLSDAGRGMTDRLLPSLTGVEYRRLATGESLTVG